MKTGLFSLLQITLDLFLMIWFIIISYLTNNMGLISNAVVHYHKLYNK